ncbi:MAG: dTDP-4-dehydrorhamnose 3,5-epimerase [Candidatus Helarchaeota archaeon]
MQFQLLPTPIEDLLLINPTVFGDKRGFFMETYNKREYEKLGLDVSFVQENESKSQKGVLRGLHFQTIHPQGKLVRVVSGKVYDVAIDLRLGSPTYLQYYGTILSEENKLIMYIPEGFAHGFLSLEDNTHLVYKVTDFYSKEGDSGISWKDPRINIKWPFKKYKLKEPILSEKDKKLPFLEEIEIPFKYNKL